MTSVDVPQGRMCFVGPPGVGKTSVGRSIVNTIGQEFQRYWTNSHNCVCNLFFLADTLLVRILYYFISLSGYHLVEFVTSQTSEDTGGYHIVCILHELQLTY